MTSVNPGDVGQFSLCGRRLHWWQTMVISK
jgi:hypothetical protein